jgi:hypothetical protein
MLLDSSGMLLAELLGMLSRLGSMLPISKGILSLKGILSSAGMLLAELLGMLPGMLLAELPGMLLGMLPAFGGMLPASMSTMLKNSASAAFTPAEYIKPFLDISPFFSQKAIRACSTAGSR